jgi:hypothetical protein
MLQRRRNRTEVRLMDSYIQILCRFQKCISEKFLHRPSSVMILKKVGFYWCFLGIFVSF